MLWPICIASLGVVVTAWTLCSLYNNLVRRQVDCDSAYAQIDVQLRRRHDLISNLVETVRRYLAHEYDTLEMVVRARGLAQGATAAARAQAGEAAHMRAVAQAEGALDVGLSRVLALGEAYPQLGASAEMRDLREELTVTENRVAFARQAYNDAVCRYNRARESFPAVVLASRLGFEAACTLEVIEQPEQRASVRVSFS